LPVIAGYGRHEDKRGIDMLSFRELIRLGAEKGFIETPSDWFLFREERNISSYTYDAAKVAEVFVYAWI